MKRNPVRWDELRARVRANEQLAEETLSARPERMKAVFRERAVRLARTGVDRRAASSGIAAMLFRLGPEQYAIELKELAEVTPFQNCTPVPGSSPVFPGVINLRGELRPVIDVGRVLCGSVSTESGTVLVLRRAVALKVDSVDGVRELDSAECALPADGRCLRAQTPGGVGLLDVEALMSAVVSRSVTRGESRSQ